MLMSDRITISVGSIPSFSCPREVHHVGAVSCLTAKTLAKEISNIRLIVHDQNADAHMVPRVLRFFSDVAGER
jgi:hypothetical protein